MIVMEWIVVMESVQMESTSTSVRAILVRWVEWWERVDGRDGGVSVRKWWNWKEKEYSVK